MLRRGLALAAGALCAGLLLSPAEAGLVREFGGALQATTSRGAGQFARARAEFDEGTGRFSWQVTFPRGVTRGTDALRLVVTDGGTALGSKRRSAVVYLDASVLENPIVSVYRFNGLGGDSLINPAELLASSRGMNAYGIVASVVDSGLARTFSLSLDAAGINARHGVWDGFPRWKGIRMAEEIGVFMSAYAGVDTEYARRRLLRFEGRSSTFDASHMATTTVVTPVPAPAAATALLGTLVGLATRRGRAMR